MSSRAARYASRFEALNTEVIDAVTACPGEQWRLSCANDERSVAVLAHHIALVNGGFARMVERLASGETYTPNTSMEEIHQINAQHARDYAGVDRDEVLDLLRSSGESVVTQLRRINDERFDADAGVFGGNPLTVAQVVEYVVIGHTAEHLDSISATLGAGVTMVS